MDKLFDSTVQSIISSINLRTLRHNILASNVANSDIPNFQGFDLKVEESLKKIRELSGKGGLFKTHPLHLNSPETRGEHLTITEAPTLMVPESNLQELDLNKTMAELAENALKYQATVQFLNRKIGRLKYAIEGK